MTRRSPNSIAATPISYVRKGSFGCHTRGRFFELVAGSVLVGHPGDEYVCSHDHVCGDECLSFFLSPELVETIGDRAEVWQIGCAPPLPELMVLGELAQAAADGRSDIGLDEVGQLFASRFVEVVSGRARKTGGGCRAGSPPRGGNGALDRRTFAPAKSTWSRPPRRPASARSTSCGCSPACSASPRTNIWCARGCAMRRACWPTMTVPITDIAYDVGFGDLSNFVRTFHRAAGVSPLRFRQASLGQRKIFGDRKIFQDRLALH